MSTLQSTSTIYTAAISNITSVTELICSLTFQLYTLFLLEKSPSNGGNSLGLPSSDGPPVLTLLLTTWQDKSDNETVFARIKGAFEKIRAESVAKDIVVDYVFMNYAVSFQDPISSYGEESKRKLQEVSKKYDPEGLFQKLVPGEFKLFCEVL